MDEVRAKAEAASLEFFRAGQERARSIADTLYDGLSGRMGSFWDTFKDFGLRAVTQVAGRLLTNNGGAGGGFGDIIKSTLGSFLGGAFAGGGSPPVGKISLVGERGPELFVPKVNGTIIPNHALGGAAPQTIYIEVDKSELFDVHVRRTAAPMAQQAAAVGAFAGRAAVADDFRRGSRPALPSGMDR